MELHFATVWESVADAVGEAPALIQGPVRRTWAEFDDRAARLAAAFAGAGVGAGATIAEYLYNAPEYLETFYAALKHEAVPVNVNYRYLDDELLYLLTNSDAEVLVCHASLYERVARVRDRAPALRLVLVVDDDAAAYAGVDPGERYEDALAAHDPAPRRVRDESNRMMLYTGGTTGLPKGVVTPLAPLLRGYIAAFPPLAGFAPVLDPAAVAGVVAERYAAGEQVSSLAACPLMHGTGLNLGALPFLVFGGRIGLLARGGFDPDEVWDLVERESLGFVTLVGDAFARPLLRALDDGTRRDLSSLRGFISSGAMFSTEVKAGLLGHAPDGAFVIDYIAATEGLMGYSLATRDLPIITGRFIPAPGVKVLTEEGKEVAPGSGESGLVAISGTIPEGYYHDEAKTASTFRIIDGQRWSIPGDWATVEADGQISLLGRGSQCINTGGEKVYPEEVEEVVKTHAAVEDCLVFGVPDERFGSRVVGVASLAPAAAATPDEILTETRARLASYKVPRSLVLVPEVPRAPNGKADYASARDLFAAAPTP
jgi:acyl-CoA synthetase (AMP-forming)/AMP-acid ligase II